MVAIHGELDATGLDVLSFQVHTIGRKMSQDEVSSRSRELRRRLEHCRTRVRAEALSAMEQTRERLSMQYYVRRYPHVWLPGAFTLGLWAAPVWKQRSAVEPLNVKAPEKRGGRSWAMGALQLGTSAVGAVLVRSLKDAAGRWIAQFLTSHSEVERNSNVHEASSPRTSPKSEAFYD